MLSNLLLLTDEVSLTNYYLLPTHTHSEPIVLACMHTQARTHIYTHEYTHTCLMEGYLWHLSLAACLYAGHIMPEDKGRQGTQIQADAATSEVLTNNERSFFG